MLLLEPTLAEFKEEKEVILQKMRKIRMQLKPIIDVNRQNEKNYLYYASLASSSYTSGDRDSWLHYREMRDHANPYRANNAKTVNQLKEETAALLPRLAEINILLQKNEGLYFEHNESSLGKANRTQTFIDNSPEWHAQRLKGIGGSDIAAIMGDSPWTSRDDLFLLKTQQIDTPIQKTSASMNRGHLWEPIIQNMFMRKHPEFDVLQEKNSWCNNERDYHFANVDGLLRNRESGEIEGILEIKNSSTMSSWTDGIPTYYRWQILWYLDAFGLSYGHLAALIDDWDYLEFELIPKQNEIDEMHEKVSIFVDEVKEYKIKNGIAQ